MRRTNFTALILSLCFCGVFFVSVTKAEQIELSNKAAAALAKAQAKALAAGGSAKASDAAEESGEEKESPEDALVAKLVEVKFERTPETILKAWE